MSDNSLLLMTQATLEMAQDAIDMAKKASLYKEDAQQYIQKAKKQVDEELKKAKREHEKAEQERRDIQNNIEKIQPLYITVDEATNLVNDIKEILNNPNIKYDIDYELRNRLNKYTETLHSRIPEKHKNIFGANNI